MLKYLILSSMCFTTNLMAAGGYEKQSLWSPQAVGVGGAYASSVSGSDAILYNPAALNKNEIGINFAVLGGYIKAPVKSDSSAESNDDLVYSGGLVTSFILSDKLGLGFGVYGLAGLDTKYENINYGSVKPEFSNYTKDYYGNLQVVEYSLGLSYKLTSKLSFGAAVRAQDFQANFGQTAVYRDSNNDTMYAATVEFKELKGAALGSYRLGAQYLENNWGVGITYRSAVVAKVRGKSSGDMIDAGGTLTVDGGGIARISTTIPKQINADVHLDLVKDKIRLLTGYAWTQYSKNDQLEVDATFLGQSVGNINQKWKDMHDYKFGLSFLGPTTINVGYTYTTSVTNKNYSSANASPPGPYHHYGTSISHELNKRLSIDGAFEYIESKGNGTTEVSLDSRGFSTGGNKGSYRSGVWETYLGFRYHF